MVEWHPSFTARSGASALVQVLRALMFLAIGGATILGAFAVSQAGLDSWQRLQAHRADSAHYSALGLRHVCSGLVTAECVARTASAAGVAVVSVGHGIADTAVPVRPPDPQVVARLAPDPVRAMYGHFNAVQYAGVEVADGSILGVDLYSKPTAQPAYPYRVARTIRVAGVAVTLRTAPTYPCARLQTHSPNALHCPENVWAVWHHDGQIYAANFDSFHANNPAKFLRSPEQTVRLLFPKLIYTTAR
jgi:hypothetical protein